MAAHAEMSPRAPTRRNSAATANLISGLCLGGGSPSSKHRGRPRRKNRSRVTWDEQVIEEHNKERGTRQKLASDTDSTRSPQASDSEGCLVSSDDERRFRPSQQRNTVPTRIFEVQADPLSRANVDARSLARRLDRLVKSGGAHCRGSAGSSSAASSDGGEYAGDVESSPCSSRSSSSVPTSRRPADLICDGASKGGEHKRTSGERHISLPDELVQNKPMSASFQARRILHYNDEVSAMKALLRKGPIFPGDSTPDSNNSTDDDLQTTTNTHTNLNSTMTKDYSSSTTLPSASVLSHASSALTSASATPRPSRPSSQDGGESCGSNDRGARDRAVSFSGESGGESTSEEFRSLRRRHYAREWSKERPLATANSVETNTHTNLNAVQCAASSSVAQNESRQTKNPMEEGRPPVQFTAGSANPTSSTAFLAQRAEHYNEMEAVRRFRSESTGEEDDDLASPDEIEDLDTDSDVQVDEPAQAAEAETGFIFVTPSGLTGTTLAAIGDAAIANPMEPREPRLAFRFELTSSAAMSITNTIANIDAAGNVAGGALAGDPRTSPGFTAKRDAHYSQMAAALRSMPSPSENEDDGG